MKVKPWFPMDRRSIYHANKYSAAIKSGDLLFCFGHVGSREDGTPEPDQKSLVDLAFRDLIGTLKEAGCAPDDVIDATTFQTDPKAQFETLMDVRDQYVKGPRDRA